MMHTTRAQVIAEALTWVDTPWQHHAKVKGPQGGVDCVQLMVGIAQHCGLLDPAWVTPEYSPEWHLHNQQELFLEVLERLGMCPLPVQVRQPGDLLVFQYTRVCNHTGLFVAQDPEQVIHADYALGRVVHQGLNGKLLHRLRSVYTLPGIEG